MPNIVPLKFDHSRNAMLNRLHALFERIDQVSQENPANVRAGKLALDLLREMNHVIGLHEHEQLITNQRKVEVTVKPWRTALPTQEVKAIETTIIQQEPEQLAISFPLASSDAVQYTREELLHGEDDQEQSPPSLEA